MNEQTLSRRTIAIENATIDFFESIAKQYPEIKTGDFGPEETDLFDKACTEAVEKWIKNNTPLASYLIHRVETIQVRAKSLQEAKRLAESGKDGINVEMLSVDYYEYSSDRELTKKLIV